MSGGFHHLGRAELPLGLLGALERASSWERPGSGTSLRITSIVGRGWFMGAMP